MASFFRLSFLFALLCFSTFASVVLPVSADHQSAAPLQLEKITKALSDAGYGAMSLTLEMTLPTLLSQVSDVGNHERTSSSPIITIFCPSDKAFFSLKYPQPPLTLIEYHAVPAKLERETLELSSSDAALPTGLKIDTLLHGHPLVVTSLPASHGAHRRRSSGARKVFVNGVEIKQWDVYNDGVVAVHGVDDFLDPAYQTILYPWFDDRHVGDDNNTTSDGWWSSIISIGSNGLGIAGALLGMLLVDLLIVCLVLAVALRRRRDVHRYDLLIV